MKKKILILSLLVAFIPFFTSTEVEARGNAFGVRFQERVLEASSLFNEDARERIQERITERREQVKEKREALQDVISQIPDDVLQDRLNNFQDRLEGMNVTLSERYYNCFRNTHFAL